jgi:hypothetical protein
VLCQLSYAPRLRPLDCSRPLPGIERDDELLEEQEGKGYGEDEGEREQALDEFLDK